MRFRVHLAEKLGVDPKSVEAHVIGEHGTSQVYLWSTAHVAGTAIAAEDAFRHDVENEVRYANISIIEGTGASQLGIGVVAARIAEMVGRNEGAVVPIGCYQERFGVTLSLPSRVGREGVTRVLMPTLSDDEASALDKSASTLRRACTQSSSVLAGTFGQKSVFDLFPASSMLFWIGLVVLFPVVFAVLGFLLNPKQSRINHDRHLAEKRQVADDNRRRREQWQRTFICLRCGHRFTVDGQVEMPVVS